MRLHMHVLRMDNLPGVCDGLLMGLYKGSLLLSGPDMTGVAKIGLDAQGSIVPKE